MAATFFLFQSNAVQAEPSAQTELLPDLIIESVVITPAQSGVEGEFDIKVTVLNQGQADARGFTSYLYVDQADDPPTAETEIVTKSPYYATLPPGWTYSFEILGHISNLAMPDVKVWVDPPWENNIAESNEDNNLYPTIADNEPPADGADGDEYENDDSCSEAKAITLGEVQSRNLYRNPGADYDWVYFEAEANVTYYVQAIADGIDVDLYIEPHEGKCDSGPPLGGVSAAIEVTAFKTGRFYLKVAHLQESSYGPETAYRLRVDVQEPCTAYFEPTNNACNSADSSYLALDEIASINEDETLRGQTICKPQDHDWMRFEAVAGATYTLTVSNLGERSDTQLAIFENCEDVAIVSPDDALTDTAYQITAAKSGFLYVRATHADDSEFGDDTLYKVNIEDTGAEDGCIPDQYEEDDSADQAQRFPIGEQQTYNSCPAGDQDWVQFSADAGTIYSLETFNLASDADTIVCLHDSAGEQLICNDDGGAGKASRLVWQSPVDDLYFVNVKNLDNEVAGERTQFDLTIRTDACRADSHEPDSTLTSARPVLLPDGLPSYHNICLANDEDWIWFSAAAGDSYIIETTNTAPEADTIIELYSQAGELIAVNDDYRHGTGSRIVFQADTAGRYYARVRLFNPENFGTGTKYSLQLRTGQETEAEAPIIIQPDAEGLVQGPATDIKTLIVVNERSIAEQYSAAQADLLMVKLEELAVHERVRGHIIDLDDQAITSNAYARWKRDPVSIEQANRTAAAIRQSIEHELSSNGSIEYIVLVGDDRALPFYRIPLSTSRYPESDYLSRVTTNHPTGAALRDNYYLTDDYFADRRPTLVNGRELYLPDFALGRLIETPEDMIGMIDNFLANPTTEVEQIGISAYTFVKDAGQAECDDWQSRFASSRVDCSLIGDNWSAQEWQEINLNPENPFQVLAINGHAAHSAFGTPAKTSITSKDIAASEVATMPGSLVYSMSCHAGLNVPPSNIAADGKITPTDMPEVFVRKGANYIGSTGYSYGSRSAILWTEAVLSNFSHTLVNTDLSMGQALRSAKIQYYQEKPKFSAFDEKTIQQLVFYGLPMFEISGGGTLGSDDNEDEFPAVGFTTALPPNVFAATDQNQSSGDELRSGTVTIDFPSVTDDADQPLTLDTQADGNFYKLHGHTTASAGEPIQPLHFGDVTIAQETARSAVIRSATYAIEEGFNPLVALPFNEYSTPADQIPQALAGTYPPVPVNVRTHDGESQLVTSVSQFNAEAGHIRVLDDVEVELYYSSSPDRTAPAILFVDSNYNPKTKLVNIKVEAADASEIRAVFVSYFDESVDLTGVLRSWELEYSDASKKWLGSFTHNTQPQFYVQVVDNAGNARSAVNKGMYYQPGIWTETEIDPPSLSVDRKIFLPTMLR